MSGEFTMSALSSHWETSIVQVFCVNSARMDLITEWRTQLPRTVAAVPVLPSDAGAPPPSGSAASE